MTLAIKFIYSGIMSLLDEATSLLSQNPLLAAGLAGGAVLSGAALCWMLSGSESSGSKQQTQEEEKQRSSVKKSKKNSKPHAVETVPEKEI